MTFLYFLKKHKTISPLRLSINNIVYFRRHVGSSAESKRICIKRTYWRIKSPTTSSIFIQNVKLLSTFNIHARMCGTLAFQRFFSFVCSPSAEVCARQSVSNRLTILHTVSNSDACYVPDLNPYRTVSYYTYNIVHVYTYVCFYIYTFEVEFSAGGGRWFWGIQLHVPLRRARAEFFFSVSYAPEWRLFIYGIIRRFDVVVRLPAWANGTQRPRASPSTRSDRKWSVARTRYNHKRGTHSV